MKERVIEASADSTAAIDELADSLRTNQPELHRYVVHFMPRELRQWLEPQDVVQDVFVEAFRLAHSFPRHRKEEALSWLLTVTRHKLIDLLRRHRALKRSGGGRGRGVELDDSLVGILDELAVYRRTPSRSAAAREFFAVVDEALGRLPEDYATVIRLRHIDGLSVRETAKKVRRTEKAVEALVSRALVALRMELRSASLFV